MKDIIPVVRARSKEGVIPALTLNTRSIVIRAQDYINESNGQLNSFFYKVKRFGGINKFLGYFGKIILSFIMKDDILEKVDVPIYCDLLEGIKPDFYTTPDCQTYDNEVVYSKKQLLESCRKTVELVRLCPEYTPIGHIKGCDRIQILKHYNFLKSLEINTFIFHMGDFSRHGDNKQIQKAKNYVSLIKKKDNTVFLYGFGSQKRLEEFSFVDGYITYSHVVNAQKGVIFVGRKRKKSYSLNFEKASIYNLKQMFINLKESKQQTKLIGGKQKWVEESDHLELIIQKR